MTDLVLVELFKLRKRWMPWILLAIMLAFVALLQFAPYAHYKSTENNARGNPRQLQDARESIVLPAALESSFGGARIVGGVLMVVLAASVVGAEYTWGTIRTNLILGMGRDRYMLAKLIMLLLVALLMLLVVMAAGFLFNLITTLLIDHRVDWSVLGGKFVPRLMATLGRTWAVVSVPMLLAVMVSVLGRSSALGLGIGIGYAIIEPLIAGLFGLIGGWGRHVIEYTITYNSAAVVHYNSLTGESGRVGFDFGAGLTSVHGFWAALGVLVGYSVFFLAVTLYSFRKRDIPVVS